MTVAPAAIVALDLSMRSTGLAAIGPRPDSGIILRTIRTDNPGHDFNGWTAPLRHRQIAAAIAPLVGPDTLIVKEERLPSLDVSGNSALDIAGLHAVIEYVLCSMRVPIAQVNLMILKAYAVKGSASKADMLEAAERCLTPPSPKPFNDDEADALWLLAMACHKYGRPLYQPPVHRAARIDKIEWPHWSWPTV